jgi:hypothetical protein
MRTSLLIFIMTALLVGCSGSASAPATQVSNRPVVSENAIPPKPVQSTIVPATKKSNHNIYLCVARATAEEVAKQAQVSFNEYSQDVSLANQDTSAQYYLATQQSISIAISIPGISYRLSSGVVLEDGEILEIMCLIDDLYEVSGSRIDKSVKASTLILARKADAVRTIVDDRGKHNLTVSLVVQEGWAVNKDDFLVQINGNALLSSADAATGSSSRKFLVCPTVTVIVQSRFLKAPRVFSMRNHFKAELEVRLGEFDIGGEYFRAEMQESAH